MNLLSANVSSFKKKFVGSTIRTLFANSGKVFPYAPAENYLKSNEVVNLDLDLAIESNVF